MPLIFLSFSAKANSSLAYSKALSVSLYSSALNKIDSVFILSSESGIDSYII
jgi:hypothetical protein